MAGTTEGATVARMNLTRRHFLRQAATAAAVFAGINVFAPRRLFAATPPFAVGGLVRDPHGILELPQGFTYRVLSRVGEVMADGLRVPGAFDGMAAFPGPSGLTLLVRNHELDEGHAEIGPFGADHALLARIPAERVYDRGGARGPSQGGTTTLVIDDATGELRQQFLSLAGTQRNCAGGPTPWGSWISCEETVVRAGGNALRDHGWAFEVPASAVPGLAEPIPLTALGRFRREAIAIDPATGIVYQTEDREDGLVYRFVPAQKPNAVGALRGPGRLQALALVDAQLGDVRNWARSVMKPGDAVAARWIDMDQVDAPQDDLRARGFQSGALRFARGEGMWWAGDGVVFCCTDGGARKKGQIFRYTPNPSPADDEHGTLTLVAEPNDPAVLENCDNIAVAPWGELLVCEDAVGADESPGQCLVGVTPSGGCYRIGRNVLNGSELAGVCASPDGRTLFVNIQMPGLTLAITGPWPKG